MKRIVRFLGVVGIIVAALHGFAPTAVGLTARPDVLSKLELPVPENPVLKKDLGLSGQGNFTLPQIEAELLIVEMFSMYCPRCQAEAPTVNELRQAIMADPVLKDKVKLIGIGLGNSAFEVNVFRKKYKILFPLFPDRKYEAQKAFNEPLFTPTFVVLRLGKGNRLNVINIRVGPLGNPKEYLEMVRTISGLK
jgi:thiol-disulfide isomerase/thioredoxin